jgi:hypothetical protein
MILISFASLCIAQTPTAPKSGESGSPSTGSSIQSAAPASKKPAANDPASEKAKADAAKLLTLADQLRDQLNRMNVNVLSLDVLQKTETIEKLAKKMRGEADVR